MNWQGKELKTFGDVSSAIQQIYALPEEGRQAAADEFMALYRADNEHADANVGYLTGYFGSSTMTGMLRLFRTSHPIFGSAESAAAVTPEQAFEMGKAIGEGMKGQS